MEKNVSGQKIALFVYDSATGAPKTGDASNITVYVNKDWGGVTALGDTSATELSATNDPGSYSFDLTQAETNASTLRFSGKSSTAGVAVVPLTVYTAPPSFSSFITPLDASGTLSAIGMASPNLDNQLSATSRRAAVGLSSANLDTQFNGIATNVSNVVTAVDAVPTAAENADKLLGRHMAGGSDDATYAVSTGLYLLRGFSVNGGIVTVKIPGTGTISWTGVVGADAAANPIVSVT